MQPVVTPKPPAPDRPPSVTRRQLGIDYPHIHHAKLFEPPRPFHVKENGLFGYGAIDINRSCSLVIREYQLLLFEQAAFSYAASFTDAVYLYAAAVR